MKLSVHTVHEYNTYSVYVSANDAKHAKGFSVINGKFTLFAFLQMFSITCIYC